MSMAVLLTVHDRKVKTLQCLRQLHSLLPLEGFQVDIFLVDDGCTDGTPELVASEFPDVRIIQGDGNLYWNRGMLLAWKTAASVKDYSAYLWLNDDTILTGDALSAMTGLLGSRRDCIVVGTTADETDGHVTYGGRNGDKVVEPNGEYQACETLTGNCVLVPDEVFHRIGMLDPVYSHSLGDVDYGLTARRNGIDVLVAPKIVGYCDYNSKVPKWQRPEVPFRERWKALFTPLAYTNPPEYFHYKRKNFGIIPAILSQFSIMLHVAAPKLWNKIR